MESKMNKYKGYRVMHGYLQKDVAEWLGISKANYISKENNQNFKVAEKKSLAVLYKVEEKELEV